MYSVNRAGSAQNFVEPHSSILGIDLNWLIWTGWVESAGKMQTSREWRFGSSVECNTSSFGVIHCHHLLCPQCQATKASAENAYQQHRLVSVSSTYVLLSQLSRPSSSLSLNSVRVPLHLFSVWPEMCPQGQSTESQHRKWKQTFTWHCCGRSLETLLARGWYEDTPKHDTSISSEYQFFCTRFVLQHYSNNTIFFRVHLHQWSVFVV